MADLLPSEKLWLELTGSREYVTFLQQFDINRKLEMTSC